MVACSGIWQLFNNLYDSHRILKQSFFQVICLFLHLFPFGVSRLGVIGRSMFDVHFFQPLLGKNNLALIPANPLCNVYSHQPRKEDGYVKGKWNPKMFGHTRIFVLVYQSGLRHFIRSR